MPMVRCPGCNEELELDNAYRDWRVRCPQCGREFVPGESEPPPPEAEEAEVDEEFVYGYQGAAREEALALVRGPGLALEVTGWLTFALFGVGYLIVVIGAMSGGNDVEGLLCVGCCSGIFVLPYALGIALGGRHLRRLTSRNWAMAGAVLGLMGFLSCLGVIHGVLGIWALLVIDKPVVRRAFDLPATNRRQWD